MISDACLAREVLLSRLGRVTRLGLATRGDTELKAADVLRAIDSGVNYLNWCGVADGMRDAIRRLGPRRGEVKIAVQLEARSARQAEGELAAFLGDLSTDYLDVVTYYYVERPDEWAEIIAPGGAAETLEAAREQGVVRAIGLTSHQRPLAAAAAETGRLDLLMVRYNAAHRGAEQDVFPITMQRNLPLIAFTCLRWGALLQSTPDDPPAFVPPAAFDCYRFVLSHPAVSVALMAPHSAEELEENLCLLDDWRAFEPQQYAAIVAHGQRVRRHAGAFP